MRGDRSCVRGAPWAGRGIVGRQRPRAGQPLGPRHRVSVVADRLDCAPLRRRARLDDTDTRLVDAFVGFARGERTAPQVTDRVLFDLGGGSAGELSISDADDRTTWRMCPPETYYAAGICPFGILVVLMYAGINDHPLVYAYEPRDGVCIIESALAALSAVHHLRRLVVTPSPRVASCASDFIVELYYDGERLAAVNLSLSEP